MRWLIGSQCSCFKTRSRPGPLENVKVKRFKQAQWIVLVDEQETSRHNGPAELAFDDSLHDYIKIFVDYIRPAYAADDTIDEIFIKEDGQQFPKGTIGRRVKEFLKRAGIRINANTTKGGKVKIKNDEDVEDKDEKMEIDKDEDTEDFANDVSSEEKSVLSSVFNDSIASGRLLTISEVQTKMKSVPYLRRFVVNSTKTKKFYDFVRYKTNIQRQAAETFSNQDEFDFVTSLSSSQQKAWEVHNTESIEKVFYSFSAVPNRKEVIREFENHAVLQHIFGREGVARCYENTKSLFKKRAENKMLEK